MEQEEGASLNLSPKSTDTFINRYLLVIVDIRNNKLISYINFTTNHYTLIGTKSQWLKGYKWRRSTKKLRIPQVNSRSGSKGGALSGIHRADRVSSHPIGQVGGHRVYRVGGRRAARAGGKITAVFRMGVDRGGFSSDGADLGESFCFLGSKH